MDSFKNEEVEEILEEETPEVTEEIASEEVVVTDEETIEEDSAATQKSTVSSKQSKGEKTMLKSAATGNGSSKYAGLYKDGTGKGAVIPEPVATDGSASADKQMKLVDAKRSGKVESVQVHMDAMFNGEELSEDFKTKASTIFETALNERVEAIENEIKAEYENSLIEQTETMKTELTQQLDSYLSYVVEEWMEENKLAVEKGLRTEIAEEFMEGLRGLFLQHNIEVPQGKTDILDQMAEKVEALTASLNEEINKSLEMKNKISELERQQLVASMSEGLVDTDKERFLKLAEGVGFETNNEFRTKLETIRESYFGDSGKTILNETIEDDMTVAENAPSNEQETLTESMEAYSQMLSRLSRAKGSSKKN
jgi:hypothetical protein